MCNLLDIIASILQIINFSSRHLIIYIGAFFYIFEHFFFTTIISIELDPYVLI